MGLSFLKEPASVLEKGGAPSNCFFRGRSKRNPSLSERGDRRKRKTYSLGPKVGSGQLNGRQGESWMSGLAFLRGKGPCLKSFGWRMAFGGREPPVGGTTAVSFRIRRWPGWREGEASER